jgi:predicted AAA+ superfamily ATPase
MIMATLEEQILAWNPWWADAGAIRRDPHLRAFETAPVPWDPPLLDSLPLTPGDAHTVRGPRQGGKTTLAKRLIRRLLESGESRVFYFSFDLHSHPDVLYDAIRRAKSLHPDPAGPWHLFLDEVTSVPQWQRGVKVAWDQGLTRQDFLLLTGSSAHDLKSGAEQLPGRRGNGTDFLHLPMSFRDFCIQVEKLPLPAETTDIEGFLSEEGRTLARRLHLLTSDLLRAFRTYLSVGGFPAAIRDYRSSSDRRPQPETVRMLWTVIAGDIARSGRDQTAAAKLLEEVALALGNPLKWASAARAMGMGSNNTAREYVEYLSDSFALLTVFFWDLSGGALQPSKQRKVYYMDPLLAEIPPGLMPGARRPPEAGMVENAMAIGLFRSAARALTQADPVPGAVGYWRSTNRRELDFVVPSTSRGRGGRVPIEVKGDSDSGIGHARLAILNAFGEGIVASRTVFDPEGKVPVLPIPVLLAGLAEAPRRDMAIG